MQQQRKILFSSKYYYYFMIPFTRDTNKIVTTIYSGMSFGIESYIMQLLAIQTIYLNQIYHPLNPF